MINKPSRSGIMSLPQTTGSRILKVPLFVLRLLVYSRSSVLTMAFLSIYGLIHGVARVPKNRINAMKSLLKYGVEVFQHGLGTPIQSR